MGDVHDRTCDLPFDKFAAGLLVTASLSREHLTIVWQLALPMARRVSRFGRVMHARSLGGRTIDPANLASPKRVA